MSICYTIAKIYIKKTSANYFDVFFNMIIIVILRQPQVHQYW